jgi:hypothetical protein
MSVPESPAPANAGRYPELPSAPLAAILAAQYGCIPDDDGLPVSHNAPSIVDPHHDIEASGACFPVNPLATQHDLQETCDQSTIFVSN